MEALEEICAEIAKRAFPTKPFSQANDPRSMFLGGLSGIGKQVDDPRNVSFGEPYFRDGFTQAVKDFKDKFGSG